ncbi:hypothetical protein BKA80DRAFT_281540 [Phyllosticta citrichinensis]
MLSNLLCASPMPGGAASWPATCCCNQDLSGFPFLVRADHVTAGASSSMLACWHLTSNEPLGPQILDHLPRVGEPLDPESLLRSSVACGITQGP